MKPLNSVDKWDVCPKCKEETFVIKEQLCQFCGYEVNN